MGLDGPGLAELSVSDHGQLGSLAKYLRLAVPGVRHAECGQCRGSEQGALDVLMIVADTSPQGVTYQHPIVVSAADHTPIRQQCHRMHHSRCGG